MPAPRGEQPAAAGLPLTDSLPAVSPPPDAGRRRVRLSISRVLTLGVGMLMLLAGIAYGIALVSGRLNTVELLRDRNDRILSRLIERTQLQLDPAARQVEALRQQLQTKHIGVNDVGRLTDYMIATLDALPQVDAIGLLRNDLVATRVQREPGGRYDAMHGSILTYHDTAARDEAVRRLYGIANRKDEHAKPVSWGDLIWNPDIGQALINAHAPVVIDNVFVGETLAVVSLGTLSRLLETDSVDGEAVNFILHGDDAVLAHPTLLNHDYALSMAKPVPLLKDIHDPVLRQIWSGRIDVKLARAMLGSEGAHIVEADGRQWIFVYRRLNTYGDRPWLIGRYFAFDQIETEINRLQVSAVVGAISLILSLLVAWRLGYLIRRPLLAIGDAANRLRNLDFDTPPLERTRLRELDDAAQAINAANAALRWFGNYVPRKLVNRLVREGEDAVNTSKQRDVTVLFTDLVGFTAMSEQLSAQETADILNEHFALVTACIEAHGGIVDKFIGDAVMAVWGAIKRDENHAANACRAVEDICRALAADNARRAMLGKAILRMRLGLHSGPVVVGNIGAPGRINYTVVGDTVNTAQRLEQLGHDHQLAGEQFIALVSAETVAAAGLDPKPPRIGDIPVKGRAGTVEIYRLDRPQKSVTLLPG
ncbi:adenylate/guanylate cyclase domain-containing protein [Ferrovibrio terrae]|uniref:adenylate/guanylate cyclase domain-containing protein n=1 Tax=Ferrovibrio terrae TaxID=2594003 RepID=UPI00313782AA